MNNKDSASSQRQPNEATNNHYYQNSKKRSRGQDSHEPPSKRSKADESEIANIKYKAYDMVQRRNGKGLSLWVNSLKKKIKQNKQEVQNIYKYIATLITESQPTASKFLEGCNAKDLALLANAFIQFHDEQEIQEVLQAIATSIRNSNRDVLLESGQSLSMFVNAFSKCMYLDKVVTALKNIAAYINKKNQENNKYLESLDQQQLATIVNGLSKIYNNEAAKKALKNIATYINKKNAKDNKYLESFNQQDLANIVNGLSKIYNNEAAKKALINMAIYINRNYKKKPTYLKSFDKQALANIVNGLSKFYQSKETEIETQIEVEKTLKSIAICINKKNEEKPTYLESFTKQGLANIVNGLSKVYQNKETEIETQIEVEKTLKSIATYINKMNEKDNKYLESFDQQGLANIVNGLSKLCQNKAVEKAVEKTLKSIAICINKKNEENNEYLESFKEQGLASIVNGLSKVYDNEAVKKTLIVIANYVYNRHKVISDSQALIEFIASFSRLLEQDNLFFDGEDKRYDTCLRVLSKLGQQVHNNQACMQEIGILDSSRLLKGSCKLIFLAKDQTHSAYSSIQEIYTKIVPLLVERIEKLVKDGSALRQTGLETLGTLSIGLNGLRKLPLEKKVGNLSCSS